MSGGIWLATAFPQIRCNNWSEVIHSSADRFARNHNSALGEQIFNVAEAQRELCLLYTSDAADE